MTKIEHSFLLFFILASSMASSVAIDHVVIGHETAAGGSSNLLPKGRSAMLYPKTGFDHSKICFNVALRTARTSFGSNGSVVYQSTPLCEEDF